MHGCCSWERRKGASAAAALCGAGCSSLGQPLVTGAGAAAALLLESLLAAGVSRSQARKHALATNYLENRFFKVMRFLLCVLTKMIQGQDHKNRAHRISLYTIVNNIYLLYLFNTFRHFCA